MLQPAAITSLLTQLINDNSGDSTFIKPHTALLTLLDSSELYAVATRLVDTPPSRSAVASMLASTAAAAGTAPPPAPQHHANGKPIPLTLDERAACLSAIAVTSWRQATESGSMKKERGVVMAGSSVSVAKHAVTGMTSVSGKKAFSRELVPLLLESDLGRILVMPIVPSAPALSQSRSELVAIDESHDDIAQSDQGRPFMLLTLNAPADGPPPSLPKSPSTPNNATSSAASGNSTATLNATQPARSRLRSGGTTPTSTRSDNTATPSRSPVSDHFPVSAQGPPPGATGVEASEGAEGKARQGGEGNKEEDAWEAKVWSGLYAQAKALARVLAPSLSKCGVREHHHGDEHHGDAPGRQSGLVSDDDADA